MMLRIASRALRATFCTALATTFSVPASAAFGNSASEAKPYVPSAAQGINRLIIVTTATGKGEEIEIHSFQWGSATLGSATGGAGGGKAKFNEFTIKKMTDKASPVVMKGSKIGENSTETTGGVSVASGDLNGDGTAAPRKPTINRATISPKSLPGSAGANETMTVGSNQTESGQATGKRQHMPLRARMYYDAPQGQGPGSLTVRGNFPSCTVGQRYAGAQFAGGGMSYALQEVEIADCGGTSAGPTEEITFVYGKVVVRGWDPEKKEQ